MTTRQETGPDLPPRPVPGPAPGRPQHGGAGRLHSRPAHRARGGPGQGRPPPAPPGTRPRPARPDTRDSARPGPARPDTRTGPGRPRVRRPPRERHRPLRSPRASSTPRREQGGGRIRAARVRAPRSLPERRRATTAGTVRPGGVPAAPRGGGRRDTAQAAFTPRPDHALRSPDVRVPAARRRIRQDSGAGCSGPGPGGATRSRDSGARLEAGTRGRDLRPGLGGGIQRGGVRTERTPRARADALAAASPIPVMTTAAAGPVAHGRCWASS